MDKIDIVENEEDKHLVIAQVEERLKNIRG